MPTKLYDPKTQDFSIDNLPQYNIVAVSLNHTFLINVKSVVICSSLFHYDDTINVFKNTFEAKLGFFVYP